MKKVLFLCLFSLGLLCSCTTDYQEKIYDLTRLYQDDYEILRSSEDSTSKDNHYLLLRKNDTIYFDEVGRRPSLKKILPNENGVELKTAEFFFDSKGAAIRNNSIPNKHDFLSAPYIYYGDYCSYISYYRVWREDKNLLYLRNEDFSLLYRVGNKEAFVLYGDAAVFDTNCIRHTERHTFADLYDNDDYSELFSLADYPFYIEKKFSYKDLSFIGFSDIKIRREGFPLKPFIKAAYDESFIVGYDEDYVYLPISSIRNRLMDIAKEAIDANIMQLEEAWYEEEERVWWEEETARIQNEAIDYEKMLRDFRHNSVKAKNTYSVGDDMILKLKINRLLTSYKDGYAYRLEHDCSLIDLLPTTIYTNDESFVQLDYPQTVIITANSINHSLYEFKDAKLWLYSK